jgi:signal transduction histidine kinase
VLESGGNASVRSRFVAGEDIALRLRTMTGVVWTRDSISEVRAVHSPLRDLVALSSAPATWVGRLPDSIEESLQNLLASVLRSERLLFQLGVAGTSHERALVTRALRRRQHRVAQRARPQQGNDAPLDVNPFQEIRYVSYPIGMGGEMSGFNAGPLHADIPGTLETQLMQVTTNDVATALRHTNLLRHSEEPAGTLQALGSQQAAIARLSHQALTEMPLHDLLQEGVRVVREGLETDCSELLELAPDGSTLLLSAGAGWNAGAVGVAHVKADCSSLAGYTLDAGVPVIVQDMRTETRFEPWRFLRESAVISSISVPLRGTDRPFGVLGAHSRTRRVFTSDDVHFLQSVSNLLAVTLQQRHAESERESLLARTTAAHAEAERASRDKTQHLASMSHELRTPLNAIAGYVEMMEMGIHGPLTAAQRSDLGRIRHNQRYLLRLINSVLTFMKLDSGHVEYELSVVSIAEMLAAIEQTVRPQMQAKQLKYRKRKPEIELHVLADGGKVQQILVNLLSNATKFTEPRGVVEVDFLADDRVVRTQVRDSGRGIPSVELERVFEPFVQVKDPAGTMTEGTGLGLAISRQFAEGMNGRLYAESERGKGSLFTLELPRAR